MKAGIHYLAVLLLVIVTHSTTVKAQGETNIWYFGNNAGLDFNTNPPTALTNGVLVTSEGCASIADKNGSLLFYTDGTTVWNKSHVAMSNGTGLLGNSSSAQSAIIVPYPGTYNYGRKCFDKYYIVTVDYVGGPNGVNYTEVDMSLNAGLGDVTAVKNVNLITDPAGTSEKVCVAQHSNNCDFSKDYNAYLVSSAGFNATPVISTNVALNASDVFYLKSSPNSKLVANANYYSNSVEVYDFNNTTGILSPKFSLAGAASASYGVEFSLDSKVVYNTGLYDRNIYQYDLTVANNAAFATSKTSIGTTATAGCSYFPAALQLAPNGKIYIALCGDNMLSVINSPNTLGVACGFSDRTVSLAGRTSVLGLPALATSLIRPKNKITSMDSCQAQKIYFGLTDTSKIISYDWRFAKLATPNNLVSSSTLYNPVKTFATADNYLIMAINHYACYVDTLIDTLRIVPLPTTTLTATMVDCFGAANGAIATVAATGTAPYTYAWSNAATTASITALTPAKYVVTVTDANGCTKKDSATITEPASALSISNTIVTAVKCKSGNDGTAIIVAAGGTKPYTYSWNTVPVKTTAGITGLTAGTYTVTVKDAHNCTVTGTVVITEPTALKVVITGNKANCANDANAQLTTLIATASNGTGPSYSYSWTPGTSTTNTVVCNSTVGGTLYTVTAKDQNNCTTTDTVTHLVNPNPMATYTVNAVCVGDSSAFKSVISVVPVANITLYAWQFSGTGVPATATSSGINPKYKFATCNQNYSATLVVQSNKGCIGVSNLNPIATVYCLPVPNFTLTNGCEKDAVITFNNTSTNGAGTTGGLINTWHLDATGAITNTPSPTKTYATAGDYTINLKVLDVNGCKDSVSKPLKIFPKPTADFTLTKACLGKPTLMSNNSSIVNPAGFTDVINDYKWDFDFLNNNFTQDANTSGASTTYSLIATEQRPAIAFVVTTNNNCSDTTVKPVTVWPLPVADYTVTEVCYPHKPLFTNNSSVAVGTDNSTISTMLLAWGDGNSDAPVTDTSTLHHTYTVSNSYVTQLTVTSNHACETKLQVPIIVHPKPSAKFTIDPNEGCSPVCVTLTNTSTQSNAPTTETITNYAWNMGDYSVIKLSDNTASTPNASHCYENEHDTTQHYSIKLIVSTAFGCADTLIKMDSVTVYAHPIAKFDVQPKTVDVLNPQLVITDASHLANTIQWVYQAGDSVTTTNAYPLLPMPSYAYQYKDSGNYTLLQITKTNNGCIDTATQHVLVKPVYTVYVPNAFTPNDDKHNEYFMVRGVGIKDYTLTIYDRWGEVVARVDGATSKGWDGTDLRTSKPCQTGVYNWRLNYTDIFNAEHAKLVGNVNLLR
jgi:gliding motility-associated-like protein